MGYVICDFACLGNLLVAAGRFIGLVISTNYPYICGQITTASLFLAEILGISLLLYHSTQVIPVIVRSGMVVVGLIGFWQGSKDETNGLIFFLHAGPIMLPR